MVSFLCLPFLFYFPLMLFLWRFHSGGALIIQRSQEFMKRLTLSSLAVSVFPLQQVRLTHTHTTCCSSCLVDLYPNFEVFFCLAYTTEQCTKRKKLFSVEHMHHQTPVPLVHALRLQVRTLFSSNTEKLVSS